MAEWRAGRSTGRTLWRDEQLVGMVDSPEVAAEIVETMNRVDRLMREVLWQASKDGCGCPVTVSTNFRVTSHRDGCMDTPESGRERSLAPTDPSACRYCGHGPEDHARSVGGGLMACSRCPLGLCGEYR